MSYITNLVLVVAGDSDNPGVIDEWLKAKSDAWWLGSDLVGPADMGGGSPGGRKYPEVEVYCAALNGFWAEEEFVAFLGTLDWSDSCGGSVAVLTYQETGCRVIQL